MKGVLQVISNAESVRIKKKSEPLRNSLTKNTKLSTCITTQHIKIMEVSTSLNSLNVPDKELITENALLFLIHGLRTKNRCQRCNFKLTSPNTRIRTSCRYSQRLFIVAVFSNKVGSSENLSFKISGLTFSKVFDFWASKHSKNYLKKLFFSR